MKLIIGLGNPDTEYAGTRHNIGFMAIDSIVRHLNCPEWKNKFKGLVTSGNGNEHLFLKPLTYMNLSGESAIEATQFYKINTSDVIVFHDDLDLESGVVRVKQGGGHGGHNGLKSLDAHLGKDYWRVRLGIGHPLRGVEERGGGRDEIVSNYVLGKFAKSDKAWLEPLLDNLAQEFELLLSGRVNDYAARTAQQIKG